eukprot:10763012-Lingulodinium_polyedra.AAC.1
MHGSLRTWTSASAPRTHSTPAKDGAQTGLWLDDGVNDQPIVNHVTANRVPQAKGAAREAIEGRRLYEGK